LLVVGLAATMATIGASEGRSIALENRNPAVAGLSLMVAWFKDPDGNTFAVEGG
jgi:hypothetical protein